jgi:hypothetical protein
VSEDTLKSIIEASGFTVDHWSVETDAVTKWAKGLKENGLLEGPRLTALLQCGKDKVVNLVKAILKGQVQLVAGGARAK